MTSHPPRIATWLLRTLGSGSEIEVLLGDLSKEYRAGRSRAWFWWQVMVAVLVTFLDDVRAHPRLAVRAAAVGILTLVALDYLAFRAVNAVEFFGYPWPGIPVAADHAAAGVRASSTITISSWFYLYEPLLTLLAKLATVCASAWLVARLHVRLRTSAVLAFTATLVLIRIYARATAPVVSPDASHLAFWFSSVWYQAARELAPLFMSLLGGLGWQSHRAVAVR
jgi:hypothetical protein